MLERRGRDIMGRDLDVIKEVGLLLKRILFCMGSLSLD